LAAIAKSTRRDLDDLLTFGITEAQPARGVRTPAFILARLIASRATGRSRFLFDQLHGSLAGGKAVQSGIDDVMLRAPPLDPEPPLDPKPFVFGLAGRL
jgi:hypothetical protein